MVISDETHQRTKLNLLILFTILGVVYLAIWIVKIGFSVPKIK